MDTRRAGTAALGVLIVLWMSGCGASGDSGESLSGVQGDTEEVEEASTTTSTSAVSTSALEDDSTPPDLDDERPSERLQAIEEIAGLMDLELSEGHLSCIDAEGILEMEVSDAVDEQNLGLVAIQKCAPDEFTSMVTSRILQSPDIPEEELDTVACILDEYSKIGLAASVEEMLSMARADIADIEALERENAKLVAPACGITVEEVEALTAGL